MAEIEEDATCRSCGFRGAPLKEYRYSRSTRGSRLLCKLCAGTPAGNAEEYPERYMEQSAQLKTICFVGNEILNAISKSNANVTMEIVNVRPPER